MNHLIDSAEGYRDNRIPLRHGLPFSAAACLVMASFIFAIADVRADDPPADIVEVVHADGSVDDRLETKTGWKSVRGFRCQILIAVRGEPLTPADLSHPLATGTRFFLTIEPVCDLWIYVLNRDSLGQEQILFPLEERNEPHLLVRKGDKVTLPPDGKPFRLTEPAGTEQLRILGSTSKLPWMTPRELFALDRGERLQEAEKGLADRQRSARHKSLELIDFAQRQHQRSEQTTENLLTEGLPQEARTKDVLLVPPADESGQWVLNGSPEGPSAPNQPVTLWDLEIRHQ